MKKLGQYFWTVEIKSFQWNALAKVEYSLATNGFKKSSLKRLELSARSIIISHKSIPLKVEIN